MSDHEPGGTSKTKAQDLFGILACMLGGFSAVSVFLAMEGQESRNVLARPVEGLMSLFGAPAALVVALGLALFGVVLFLGRRAITPLRHLVGLFALGLGASLVVGGVSPRLGGLLGSALPAAFHGIPGQAASFLIGLTVLLAATWVVWLSRLGSPLPRAAGSKPAGLAGILKGGAAERPSDGVSVAEARALQGQRAQGASSSRPSPKEGSSGPFSALPTPKPIDARTQVHAAPGASQPIGDPGLRSRAAPGVGDAALSHVAAQVRAAPLARPIEHPASAARPVAPAGPVESPDLPLPSWESFEEKDNELAKRELEEDLAAEEEAELDADLDQEAAPLSRVSFAEPEDEDGFEMAAAASGEEEPLAVLPLVSEEEPDLLDDEDELEVESVLVEAFEEKIGDPEPLAVAVEDGPEAEPTSMSADRAPAERQASARWEQVSLFDEPAEAEHEPPAVVVTPAARETEPAYVLTPQAERRIEPLEEAEAPADGPELDALTYEAGCLVLEQNRVAVSMLQKRFELDFDQACEVLDRLQGAGLIGPYVGGRSREILLSREEWESVAHA
jgi:hypothetical protein